MKATTKRLVGILLAMAMVLAMLPMAVSAEAPTTLYLQPNSNWMQDGARFAAVLATEGWGSQIWVDVLDTDGDGLYELNIPQDGNAYAIVIFCRMNPNAADNNWNNRWNQTKDLTVPADNKVVYVVDGWDKGNGQWIEKGGEAEEIEAVYYLRGTLTSWDTTETALTNNGDGTYSITIALAAGSYEYKIADEGWGTSWPAGDNATLTVYSDCDVTFVLNTADGSITVTGDGLSGEPLPEPVYEYYVAGSEELCGVAWDPAAEENKMTWDDMHGGYAMYYHVMPGTYEFKITTGSWDTPSYGDGNGNMTLKINGHSLVVIVFNPETQEINCIVNEFASDFIKWQLNADASADDETVDLRFVTYVETLDYAKVEFYATINGVESEAMVATTVYESIVAGGTSLTCEDIFDTEGYLVTYTIENLPAEYYDAEILVEAVYYFIDGGNGATGHRTVVVSDAF